ncbi:MAG: hypothetical protein ACXWSD_19370 [Bdellovibrionota bacterium]
MNRKLTLSLLFLAGLAAGLGKAVYSRRQPHTSMPGGLSELILNSYEVSGLKTLDLTHLSIAARVCLLGPGTTDEEAGWKISDYSNVRTANVWALVLVSVAGDKVGVADLPIPFSLELQGHCLDKAKARFQSDTSSSFLRPSP